MSSLIMLVHDGSWSREGGDLTEATVPSEKESQRDSIPQPKVGYGQSRTCQRGLPWVNRQKDFPTLNGLHHVSRQQTEHPSSLML